MGARICKFQEAKSQVTQEWEEVLRVVWTKTQTMEQLYLCILSIRGCLPPEADYKTSNYTSDDDLNKKYRKAGGGMVYSNNERA